MLLLCKSFVINLEKNHFKQTFSILYIVLLWHLMGMFICAMSWMLNIPFWMARDKSARINVFIEMDKIVKSKMCFKRGKQQPTTTITIRILFDKVTDGREQRNKIEIQKENFTNWKLKNESNAIYIKFSSCLLWLRSTRIVVSSMNERESNNFAVNISIELNSLVGTVNRSLKKHYNSNHKTI